MAKNRVFKQITGDGNFSVPAGVTRIQVYKRIGESDETFGAGGATSFGFKSDGKLYGWGNNVNGGLGDGTVVAKTAPTEVLNSTYLEEVESAAGGATIRNTLARDKAGALYAWGANPNGQLGQGDVVPKSSPVLVLTGGVYTKISNGGNSMFGIRNDSSLYAWGLNTSGELGVGNQVPRSSPVVVSGALLWSEVSTRAGCAIGITTTGVLYTWGNNIVGNLGDGTSGGLSAGRSTPTIVIGGRTYMKCAQGSFFFAALTTAGDAYTCGASPNGELGDNSVVTKSSPVLVVGGHTFAEIKAGNEFVMARKSDGTLWAWGRNNHGQLGDGTVTPRSSPVAVLGSHSFTKYWLGFTGTSGSNWAVAQKSDGSFYAWGEDAVSQHGDALTTSKSSPTLVFGPQLFTPERTFVSQGEFEVAPGETVPYATSTSTKQFGIINFVDASGELFIAYLA